MAAVLGRVASGQPLLHLKYTRVSQQSHANFSTLRKLSKGKKVLLIGGTVGILGAAGFAVCASIPQVRATGFLIHPPSLPWQHHKAFGALDMASVRRGYEVYKQVCSACHGMRFNSYRHMVDTFMTENRAKREAAEITVIDGPDESGKMFERPGRLSDTFPEPYPNPEAAAFANNGAKPPDLSTIAETTAGGVDYIFHLLTGYYDAPAGVVLDEGQYYNPYFKGGAISMAQALYNEIIEYEDGTPATQSQCAKDVALFLRWSFDKEVNYYRSLLLKFFIFWTVAMMAIFYSNRMSWSFGRTAKHIWLNSKNKHYRKNTYQWPRD